jgi:hypothetical protein
VPTDDSKPENPDESDGPTADDTTEDDADQPDGSARDDAEVPDGSTRDDADESDASTLGRSIPNDPTPDGVDEPEAKLLPDDPAAGLEPDVSRVPDASKNDVDPELKKRFWKLVLLFNVALFGMSLGVMLVGFEGRWQLGGAFFAVGAVAFVRGWLGYRDATTDS